MSLPCFSRTRQTGSKDKDKDNCVTAILLRAGRKDATGMDAALQAAEQLSDGDVDSEKPESCLARKPWDPLGLQGGDDPTLSACHRYFSSISSFFLTFSRREFRQAGLVSGLQNLPSPFSFSLEFVNDCEKKCLRTQGCNYYEFDCKLSICSLKRLDTTQESKFIQNDRYITGTALLMMMILS